MPSPVGHVIAGVTAGWLVAGTPRARKVPATLPWVWVWEAAIFGALGALPDVDLLFGAHSGPTHSLGAAVLVGVVAGVVQRFRQRGAGPTGMRPGTFAVACFAAYGSHVLLDWLGSDTSPPIGIMAWWPVSRDYFESGVHLFLAISRRYYHGWTFVRQNAMALLRELMILLPLLALTILVRSRWSRSQG